MGLEVTVLQNIENGLFIQSHFWVCVFFTYTNMKNDSNTVLLLFEVEDGKEILYNYQLINGMSMLLISRQLHYRTLKMDFSYKSIFQDCGHFLHQKWTIISMLWLLLFEVQDRNEKFICCSPVIGWHENKISFEVAVLHNIEIGFFIQAHFWECGFFTYTNVKNDTNAALFVVWGWRWEGNIT